MSAMPGNRRKARTPEQQPATTVTPIVCERCGGPSLKGKAFRLSSQQSLLHGRSIRCWAELKAKTLIPNESNGETTSHLALFQIRPIGDVPSTSQRRIA